MIEVKNLVKRFGDLYAVDNVSFTINDGEIVGFLGPNGAGKSTTMNMITGFIEATSGDIIVNGADIAIDPKKVKKDIPEISDISSFIMKTTISLNNL